jgi:hypothetical protein
MLQRDHVHPHLQLVTTVHGVERYTHTQVVQLVVAHLVPAVLYQVVVDVTHTHQVL